MWIRFWVATCVVAGSLGAGCGEKQVDSDELGGSKAQVAKLVIDRFAFQDGPQWQVSTGKACPESLLAVAQFVGKSAQDIVDPWGTPYELSCGKENLPPGATGAFAVLSYGPDKKKGTEDDIKSWEKK